MKTKNTKKNYINYIAIIGLLMLILSFICTYTVNVNQKVISSKFGKISLIEESGLHFKLPTPFQKITHLDMRRQIFEGKLIETRLEDNNFLIKIFASWQIAEEQEILFYQKLNSFAEAQAQLNAILSSTQKQVFQNYKKQDLFNKNNTSKLNEIEQQILYESNEKATFYGLKIYFVGISQINLTEKASGSVLKRMSAEQNRLANEIKIKGDSNSNKIKTEANAFKQKTLTEAKRKAKAYRNEAIIESVKLYTTHKNLDNDFAIFLRKLDALEEILKRSPTLILDSETEPFSLLKSTNE